jgi:hypothetical protein
MTERIKLKNFIPLFIFMFFIALIIGLMPLGHSRYALFGEMSYLTSPTLGQTIVETATLFSIIFLCLTFVFLVLELISVSLYNLHFLALANLALLIGAIVLECLYVGFAYNGTIVVNGVTEKLFLPANWTILILELVCLISYVSTYIVFIRKPYYEIKNAVKEKEDKEKAYADEEREKVHQELAGMNREQLLQYIQKQKDDNKITEEQYLLLIKELTNKDNKDTK